MNEQFDNRKQDLINIIEWYRDEWHKSDWCHSEMIENINKINDEKQISIYEQVVDGWLE